MADNILLSSCQASLALKWVSWSKLVLRETASRLPSDSCSEFLLCISSWRPVTWICKPNKPRVFYDGHRNETTAGPLCNLILWDREGQVPGCLKQIGEYPGGLGDALGWDLEDRGISHFENMIQYTSRRTRHGSHSLVPGDGEKVWKWAGTEPSLRWGSVSKRREKTVSWALHGHLRRVAGSYPWYNCCVCSIQDLKFKSGSSPSTKPALFTPYLSFLTSFVLSVAMLSTGDVQGWREELVLAQPDHEPWNALAWGELVSSLLL